MLGWKRKKNDSTLLGKNGFLSWPFHQIYRKSQFNQNKGHAIRPYYYRRRGYIHWWTLIIRSWRIVHKHQNTNHRNRTYAHVVEFKYVCVELRSAVGSRRYRGRSRFIFTCCACKSNKSNRAIVRRWLTTVRTRP